MVPSSGETRAAGAAALPPDPISGRSGAFLVGLGILASRVAGLVRQRVLGHFLGVTSDAADAFSAAFRIPNLLQNLFGEGALSASFIPVYAGQLGRGDREGAARTAGAIGALLGLTMAVAVLVGVLGAPVFVDVIAAGFTGPKRDLTVRLVRILFPGAGLLAFSAWCLGILNSHRRFLLSYAAPVAWNVAIIAALLYGGGRAGAGDLAVYAAWGSVVGSLLQVLVQLPTLRAVAGNLRFRIGATAEVRTVIRNFSPALVGRGVAQLSAYVDVLLATLLPTGAVAGLLAAQVLYNLPVSLFGMSVAASELPAMSSMSGPGDEVARYLRGRLDRGLRHIAYYVVPSAAAFAGLGHVLVGLLFQSGAFSRADTYFVWAILAGSSIGLLAQTMSRLYTSALYALGDPRSPVRYALTRIALGAAVGAVLAFAGPPLLGIDRRWGAAGLTAASGLAGWVEFLLYRRALARRIGATGLLPGAIGLLWLSAVLAVGVAWGALLALPDVHPIVEGVLALAAFGVTYLLLTTAFGVPESDGLWRRLGLRRGP